MITADHPGPGGGTFLQRVIAYCAHNWLLTIMIVAVGFLGLSLAHAGTSGRDP